MFRHIVFFTAIGAHTIDAICEGLALLGTIPYSTHFEVSRNSKVDQISNEVDVVVYAEFADAAALAAYKAHPTYAEATRRVRPLRELRLSADFLAP
ncbi:MAG: Dabb family protein [Devosia sp.]